MAASRNPSYCFHFTQSGYCYNREQCHFGTHLDCCSDHYRSCGCRNRNPERVVDIFRWLGGFKFLGRKFPVNLIINTGNVFQIHELKTVNQLKIITKESWTELCSDPRVPNHRVITWERGMKELIDTLQEDHTTQSVSILMRADDSGSFRTISILSRGTVLSNRSIGAAAAVPQDSIFSSDSRDGAAAAAVSRDSIFPSDSRDGAAAAAYDSESDDDMPSLHSVVEASWAAPMVSNNISNIRDRHNIINDYIYPYINQSNTNNHAIIDSFPVCVSGLFSISCAVCQEESNEDELIMTLPCFHRFHKDCIEPWITQNPTCPTCKHNIRSSEDESSAFPDYDTDEP